jgi:hypothetical protein
MGRLASRGERRRERPLRGESRLIVSRLPRSPLPPLGASNPANGRVPVRPGARTELLAPTGAIPERVAFAPVLQPGQGNADEIKLVVYAPDPGAQTR